jgi:hypothetical protein
MTTILNKLELNYFDYKFQKFEKRLLSPFLRNFGVYNYFYSRKNYYEKLLDRYKDFSYYRKIKAELEDKNTLEIEKSITLYGKQFSNEIKLHDIVKLFGKPKYTHVQDLGDNTLKVLLYRTRLGSKKVKLELHLLDNILFFYSYNFSNLCMREKQELLNILCMKYTNNQPFDFKNTFLKDQDCSALLLEDDVSFRIDYICLGGSKFFNFVNHYIEKQQEEKNRIEKENLMAIYKGL